MLAEAARLAGIATLAATTIPAFAQGGPITLDPAWNVASPKSLANMGYSLASAGDVNGDGYGDLVVGLPFWTTGSPSSPNLGYVYVFHGSSSGPSTAPSWRFLGPVEGSSCGYSVASAGDVNGDGFSDLIIGTHYHPVRVFHGSPGGLPASPSWTAPPGFEDIVASAGDVNGDGFSDVILGGPEHTAGQTQEGRVVVYQGSPGGLGPTPSWSIESDQEFTRFGNQVAAAGDVNGDGYDDVIVGHRHYAGGQAKEGRALVYHGSTSGLLLSPSWTVEGNEPNAELGYAVAGAGDVNGDGFDDVIIGVPFHDVGSFSNEGRVLVFQGSAAGLSISPSWSLDGDQAGSNLGSAVAPAGDFDGDGYPDVIVSAMGYSNGQTREGRAFIFRGAAAGLSTTASWSAESGDADSWFGFSVAGAGDLNGDGHVEVAVGAPHASPVGSGGINERGAAFLYTTVVHPAGAVPDGESITGAMLTLGKESWGALALSWGAGCRADDVDYEIYEGVLGSFTSHVPLTCGTNFATQTYVNPMPAGSSYYLIVPKGFGREGSHGRNSAGVERPQGATACLPQEIAGCP